MLNSDRDLDVSPNRQVAKSRGQSLSIGASRQYPPIVTELSIEQSKAIPIFTAATAQAVRLAGAPVSILTAIGTSGCQIGAVAGLEHFARLPTQPNLPLEFAGLEYCHDRSIGSSSSFVVTNCQKHPHLALSSLCQVHGVRAYLGVPIVTASDDRLGTLAILDFKPRQFSDRDIEILQLVSRLVASEFERKLLSQAQLNRWIGDLRYRAISGFDDLLAAAEHSSMGGESITDIDLDLPSLSISAPGEDRRSIAPQVPGEIQFKLLTHLAQEFRTPLTSVLGMASVLQQEIYGPLSIKQKNYLEIIHHSGLQLVTIVDEIAQLVGFAGVGSGAVNESQLNLKSVDLEMLCQLAIQSLEPLARKKQQQIVLDATVPLETLTGRIWLLDKDKVRQIIYYLCLSLIHTSGIDRLISIQFAKIADGLQIQITTNDPHVQLKDRYLANPLESIITRSTYQDGSYATEQSQDRDLRISLGLSLGHDLAASHGGKIEVVANRRGYQLTLPLIVAES
ncbi:GAF domain-containing sensor histidine kinase [Chamaesiphon sp. VAR_48_metabat_135_sub]|uniref:GAF domain-containing sensor histidine kinase n=1 Tax=Chamaesiphon sp. VAR_48_metabat_135_sub TaxID=2964699 RepID=UPI00286C2C63|nr:GAF domain-containing sensor histidine kinase [Chamaesiphon sp. VAR_48_metabat_135_sub]